ncbi:M28 family peptidase [Puia sp.]|uniref:M28 family peptidase n=1 Tax=Puia sp. TaxID=2045100 RepID=UPI002F423714
MKNYLPALLLILLWGEGAYAQPSGEAVTSSEVNKIILGTYNASSYPATTVITDPAVVSAGLLNDISPDSLKAYLVMLNSFQNRNTFSDTNSTSFGIGAARRWVFSKFQQYSSANDSRLRPAYLTFNYAPSMAKCGGTSSIGKHADVIAVLPGSQTTERSLIIIEAHIDSRNVSNCDVTGSAPGIGDNATGTAMVIELARVMSKYTFRNTILFAVVTGEEQGLIGATALANYLSDNGVLIKAVNNNDVSGGVFCGHTSSAPSCPFYGNIDSTDLRIFSLGDFNSPKKQWARYIKLQYKEQLRSLVTVPTNIQIMEPEDRTGRGGDHQAFTKIGYTAVRFTQANEDGNASNGTGYSDRQHNVRDSLGHYNSATGKFDSYYVDVDYLARNALVNGNSMAMVALGPDTITMTGMLWAANSIKVQFTPATSPGYRVAVRSATNDWDTVYTVTGASSAILKVPYSSNTSFYVSAAAMDANGTESQFSTEYVLSTGMFVLDWTPDTTRAVASDPGFYGVKLMPNRPNPFDEATMIAVSSGTDAYADRTWLQITSLEGRLVARIPLHLQKGMNQVVFNHGFGVAGIYICSLMIDGLPVQSTKMIFRKE